MFQLNDIAQSGLKVMKLLDPHIYTTRSEVMKALEPHIEEALTTYLKPIESSVPVSGVLPVIKTDRQACADQVSAEKKSAESIKPLWQPADELPNSSKDSFFKEVKDLQDRAKELPYELLVVLIADTITEEALPTYASWLSMIKDMPGEYQQGKGPWHQWIRSWTAEENRHGDALNRYLYLSGRVNMRNMEVSTQHLIADGFDIGTDSDPYKNFIYTSFQEIATNISHRRVAEFAKKAGDKLLSKLCGLIASDENRHAKAYQSFVSKIIPLDPNELLLAFAGMMRNKIVMPAHFLRELGGSIGDTFNHFSAAAQQIGVYTSKDYVNILKDLIETWNIGNLKSLNEIGEQSRDYLMKLPNRLSKIADRIKIPKLDYRFNWILEPKPSVC